MKMQIKIGIIYKMYDDKLKPDMMFENCCLFCCKDTTIDNRVLPILYEYRLPIVEKYTLELALTDLTSHLPCYVAYFIVESISGKKVIQLMNQLEFKNKITQIHNIMNTEEIWAYFFKRGKI